MWMRTVGGSEWVVSNATLARCIPQKQQQQSSSTRSSDERQASKSSFRIPAQGPKTALKKNWVGRLRQSVKPRQPDSANRQPQLGKLQGLLPLFRPKRNPPERILQLCHSSATRRPNWHRITSPSHQRSASHHLDPLRGVSRRSGPIPPWRGHTSFALVCAASPFISPCPCDSRRAVWPSARVPCCVGHTSTQHP